MYISNLARDMGAALDKRTTIRESRVNLGTYSDSQKSFIRNEATMEPLDTEEH